MKDETVDVHVSQNKKRIIVELNNAVHFFVDKSILIGCLSHDSVVGQVAQIKIRPKYFVKFLLVDGEEVKVQYPSKEIRDEVLKRLSLFDISV